MRFVSKYANYRLAVDTAVGPKTLCFECGALDSVPTSKQVGMTDKAVIEALKGSDAFGVDYDVAGKDE
jgi:hypothetical protein